MMPLVLLAAVAPTTSGTIAPPLDVPLHQTSEEVRSDGNLTRRFRITRRLRFTGEPGGYRVAIVTTAVDGVAPVAERRRYVAANQSLIGYPIVVHLSASGALIGVDDLDALWARWRDGLVAAAPADRAAAQAMAARLDALPAIRRAAMFGSIATDVFAAPAERVPSPPRPITLPSPPPFADATLTGVADTVLEGSTLRSRTTGSATITAANGRDSARVAVESVRAIDAATGLIATATRTETISGPRLNLTVKRLTKVTW